MKVYAKNDELENALKEKHTPNIKAPEKVKVSEEFEVMISIGEKVPHPNTIEHHIKWIEAFVEIEERAFNPVHIATFDFGPTFAEPKVKLRMKLEKTANLTVLGYCNLHGIWESSIRIKVE